MLMWWWTLLVIHTGIFWFQYFHHIIYCDPLDPTDWCHYLLPQDPDLSPQRCFYIRRGGRDKSGARQLEYLLLQTVDKNGMWDLFNLKNYELYLNLKMKMRMVSIWTILIFIPFSMWEQFSLWELFSKLGKSPNCFLALFLNVIQGHNDCAFKKVHRKMVPSPE